MTDKDESKRVVPSWLKNTLDIDKEVTNRFVTSFEIIFGSTKDYNTLFKVLEVSKRQNIQVCYLDFLI